MQDPVSRCVSASLSVSLLRGEQTTVGLHPKDERQMVILRCCAFRWADRRTIAMHSASFAIVGTLSPTAPHTRLHHPCYTTPPSAAYTPFPTYSPPSPQTCTSNCFSNLSNVGCNAANVLPKCLCGSRPTAATFTATATVSQAIISASSSR